MTVLSIESESKTTIQISGELWKELNSRKEEPGDTFEEIIWDLVEDDSERD